MKKIQYVAPLLFLIAPLSVNAFGVQCDLQSKYIFLVLAGVFSITSIGGIILFVLKLKKRTKTDESGIRTSASFPLGALIFVILSVIIAGYAIYEITADGPISRRTNDCVLGFDVHTEANSAVLDIDALTSKSEVENLYATIRPEAYCGGQYCEGRYESLIIRGTPCLHIGTDGDTTVFEATYCDWVEDAYPRFYNADGSKSYLSANTLNAFQWDQRNLLEYFEIHDPEEAE